MKKYWKGEEDFTVVKDALDVTREITVRECVIDSEDTFVQAGVTGNMVMSFV
jgi:hypothetical protein